MTNLQNQLQCRTHRLESVRKLYQKRLEWAFNARLATAGLFLFFLVLATVAPQFHLQIPVLIIGPTLFVVFALRSQRIQKFIKKISALQAFYERQALRRNGIPKATGAPFMAPQWAVDHCLNRDLDILGEHSLFHLIDETITQEGSNLLLKNLIRQAPLTVAELEARQEQIKNMTTRTGALRRIVIEAQTQGLHRATPTLKQALLNPVVGPTFHRDYRILLMLYLALLVSLPVSWFWLPSLPVSWLFMAFALFSLGRLQQTGKSFTRGQDMALTVEPWSIIFTRLQDLQQSPQWPDSLLSHIGQHRPARQFARLNRWLDFLSVQSHPLILILLNLLTPWSYVFSDLIERTRKQLAVGLESCLTDLHEFEVLQSFAFVYLYQPTQFPKFVNPQDMRLNQIYHPLLPRDQIMANSFSWKPGEKIALITGSNMSGKSTFLRAVGLHQVMALAGAPVFALAQCQTPRLAVISSMRVADSVAKGYSSFFAEVTSVKDILDCAKQQQILFLIDEIFSGTNNRERLIGSYSVLCELLKTESYGFISTHDLELTSIGPQDKIANWHFREDIENESMVFRYQLLAGPCPTTNALRVMEMAGLKISMPPASPR